MTSAIIVGGAGQDGRILAGQLRAQGTDVLSLDRDSALWWPGGARAPETAEPVRLDDAPGLRALLARLKPWAVFYLAAHHHAADEKTGDEGALWRASLEVHVEGAVNVLEAIRGSSGGSRFFYAGSSLMFGEPEESPQSEATPWRPREVYGITKTAGAEATGYFRSRHGLHASVGILFNHESPLRPPRFLSRRIADAARASRSGAAAAPLEISDLSTRVDWGWAPDFTLAMQKIVAHDTPADWVVATGAAHSVEEMCRIAFACAGADHRAHVRETGSPLQRRTRALVGDASRLRAATGWSPTLSFESMVRAMVEGAPLGD